MSASISDRFDYLIVGGGSAGCVLANRLSADPRVSVLLLEAGQDLLPGKEPAALRDPGVRAIMLPQYFWSELVYDSGRLLAPLPQARVMGGGSSINGMVAQRGVPRDYDEWRQYGVVGWGWDDVLPFFKRLEHDLDFGGPDHGTSGPIQISRVQPSQWSGLTKALQAVLKDRGTLVLEDFNAEFGDGMAPTPLNSDSTTRMSTAARYLTREVRARPNLKIMADTHVLTLLLEDRRAVGVRTDAGEHWAANIILCAGAIHSPTLLLRSGIGPGAQLNEAGVPLVADRAGVGGNLRNHPILAVTMHVRRGGRQHGFRTVRQPAPMIVRYSSKHPAAPGQDMMFNMFERLPGPLADDPLGRQLAQLMVVLNKSYSQGEVRLNSADPALPPSVKPNILSDPRDLDRMVGAFRMICDLIADPRLEALITAAFVIDLTAGFGSDPLMTRLLQDNLTARLLSIAGAVGMDVAPMLRRKVTSSAGQTITSLLEDGAALPERLRHLTMVGGHPGGTCRLGAADRPDTVVDSRCRVVGVDGLRVVDASIFPTLMTAGTNLPVIMAAERAADLLLQDRRSSSPGSKARETAEAGGTGGTSA